MPASISHNARRSLCLVLDSITYISAKLFKCLAALALFCLFSAVPAIAGTNYWPPWVTELTTNSATINWQGADTGLGSVEYATSSYYEEHKSFQNTVASDTTGAYQHVPLAGLEPDTSYVYKVTPPDNPDVFSNRTFRTMPVSGPFTFLVISDSHAQEQRFKPVADAIATYETDPLFILDGGDYTSFDYEPYWTDYFQYADKMLGKFPIFNTIGNHEYHNLGKEYGPPTDAAQYHQTFNIPQDGALNYSFDCSNIRFVVLNSPDPNNSNGDDPQTSLALANSQVPWLKEQLDNTMAGTFTIHHHPIWDYGRTTTEPHLQPWETLYHDYNISANFTGHTHSYQRYSVEGIPYFIIGNAGGEFINMTSHGTRAKWYQYGETRQLGYLKVTVDPANNTATAQEIFVAYVKTNDSEDPIVYDEPIIADTVTFPLSSTLSTLTVAKAGLGSGTVTSSPPGISCGPDCSTCSANFKKVETVVLTATPETGSVFKGWTGAGTGQGTRSITMHPGDDINVGAVFEKSTGTVPGKPTNVQAVRGNGQATVSFTAPEDGGSPITSYTVTSDPEGITVTRAGGSASPITITGLTYNIPYTFTVTAANANGPGAPSDPSAPMTPTGAVPGAPTMVTAERNGSQSLNVSFTAPSANGSAITGYTVTSRPGGITATGSASPITVSGLENGTAYSFSVKATNGIGTGPASAWSPPVIPATVPGAPTSVTATPGNLQATIAFKTPVSNGGMPITSYTLTFVNPASSMTITKVSSPIIVTGLRNMEYTFNIRANNAIGAGASSSVSVTPAAIKPGAPTVVSASIVKDPAGGKASVIFTPPESDGGTAITEYTVTSYPGEITATGNGSPITVKDLKNGTSYAFKVTATNKVGTGPASASSNSVKPSIVPGKPIIGIAIKGNGQSIVSFSAPPAVNGVPGNGGSPITSYTVTSDPEGITATRTGSSASPITVTGLTGGISYTFTVTATNLNGSGVPSDSSAPATPTSAKPGAPTDVTATPGDGEATVSFTAPLANGSPIQFYTVTSNPGGFSAHGLTADPITVTGLTNATAYTFKVTATNWIGTGPAGSSQSVTPSTVPFAPTNIKAVRGNGQATVSFTAPVANEGVPGNGGSPITSYTVSVDGISVTRTASPILITGLENGKSYTFKVWADNKNGKGAEGTSNEVTPATVPGAPTIDGTESGNSQVTVMFTAPTIDGGSPITSYTVISSPGGKTATAASSQITVTGLRNGTAYTFTVRATNDVGTGPASAPSGKAIPRAESFSAKLITPGDKVQYDSRDLMIQFSSELDKNSLAGNIDLRNSTSSLIANCTVEMFPGDNTGKTVWIRFADNFSLEESSKYYFDIRQGLRYLKATSSKEVKEYDTVPEAMTYYFVTSSRCPLMPALLAEGDLPRTKYVIVSDIHMGDSRATDNGYNWFSENITEFEKFLDDVAGNTQVKELIIAGDLFDEWEMPVDVQPFEGAVTNSDQFFQSVANSVTMKPVIDRLNSIADGGLIRLVYIPGNHDMLMTEAAMKTIFPNAVWAGTNASGGGISGTGIYSPETGIKIEHGHIYDFYNAPDPLTHAGSHLPPGYFVSRMYSTKMISGKQMMAATSDFWGNAFFYGTWEVMLYHIFGTLNPAIEPIITGIDGYTNTYTHDQARDLYFNADIAGKWNQRQSLNGVYSQEDEVSALLTGAGLLIWGDLEVAAQQQYFIPKRAEIVVFGHTHMALLKGYNKYNKEILSTSEGLQLADDQLGPVTKIYANSGTWANKAQTQKGYSNRTYVVISPAQTANGLDTVSLYRYDPDADGKTMADSLLVDEKNIHLPTGAPGIIPLIR